MSRRKAAGRPDARRRAQNRVRPVKRGDHVDLNAALAELHDVSELHEAILMATRVRRLPWLDRVYGAYDEVPEDGWRRLDLNPSAMVRLLTRIHREHQQRMAQTAAMPAKRKCPR